MSQIRRWTDEDVSVLKELLDKGWLYKDIAMELGRTRYAAQSKARDLGLVSRVGTNKKNTAFGEQFNQAYKDFVYVGGYTNNISAFTLKCKKCGDVFERNASSLRRGVAIRCDVCYEAEVIESKLARQKELERVQKNQGDKSAKTQGDKIDNK